MVTCRLNWAQSVVYFHDEKQELQSIPLAWTSLAPVDPVAALGNGRVRFRLADLLELARLLRLRTGKIPDSPNDGLSG